jgi:hypothetical protein
MPQHTHAPSLGEHPGKTPAHDDERDDEDDAPTTPTDEPPPIPVQDPPSDERPRPPLTVAYPVLSERAA